MVLPIKAIYRANKIRKDGTSLIFLQYCYSATQRTLLNTEIAIPINYWNKKHRCVSEKLPVAFGNHEQLNAELKRQFRIVEELVAHPTKSDLLGKGLFVKNSFSPTLDTTTIIGKVEKAAEQVVAEKKAKLDIYYQFDEYIKSKERKVSKATLTCIRQCKITSTVIRSIPQAKDHFQKF
jgi:hypothetical protein